MTTIMVIGRIVRIEVRNGVAVVDTTLTTPKGT
jgi:hypothetical protein